MVPNHVIMIANAIVLIILGVGGYFGSETKSLTAFIGPAVGVILLILAIPTKKENAIAAHIAVGITGILAVVIIFRGIKSGDALILIMGVATITAFIFYIANFFIRKKMREGEKK
ncbi:MAG TPA: hypothetical protein VJ455_09720 [Ignavibacteria bacterium]|nr:hypothetical protein [Ignavibacteria bacterium]